MIAYAVSLLEPKPPEVLASRWREITAAAMGQTALRWHDDVLPGHFRAEAKAKYGYQPRSARYLQQKLTLFARGNALEGGLVDLVKTGTLRAALAANASILQGPTKAELLMIGPRYTAIRRPGSPDKAAEITRMTAAEQADLSRFQADFVAHAIEALHEPKTTS